MAEKKKITQKAVVKKTTAKKGTVKVKPKPVVKKALVKKKTAVQVATAEKIKKMIAGKKKVKKTTEYSLIYDEDRKEVDLHFSLSNPVEDRYFAYALSLMDIHQTMEGLMKHAPPQVVAEFMTAVKVLKGMSESIKQKIEEDAGFKTSGIPEEDKEKIKKILAQIKERIQKDFPDAEIVVGKSNPSDLKNALRDAIEEAKGNRKRKKDNKSEHSIENEEKKFEENITPPTKPSQDLEMD
jgi:hypothetical protein